MSIKFCSLSSGSSGNCQYIETENMKVLIDGGFSGKTMESLLKSIEVQANTIDAILVTHEHIDHIKGVGVFSRRYDIPIFANENTWRAMSGTIGKIKEQNIKIFKTEEHFELKDLTVCPINIFHDALEPVGYVFFYKNKKISVVTDTGMVNEDMKKQIKNSNLYLLESNHDIKMLKEGNYPWSLKQRILSTRGHLSNNDSATTLGEVLNGEQEVILLGHLSKDNNTPEIAYNTVSTFLENKGLKLNKDISLDLTYRDKVTNIYKL